MYHRVVYSAGSFLSKSESYSVPTVALVCEFLGYVPGTKTRTINVCRSLLRPSVLTF